MSVCFVSVRSLLYEFLFWAGLDSPATLAGWFPPPPPFLARKSGGHCTHPTGGPSFALNTKNDYVIEGVAVYMS